MRNNKRAGWYVYHPAEVYVFLCRWGWWAKFNFWGMCAINSTGIMAECSLVYLPAESD